MSELPRVVHICGEGDEFVSDEVLGDQRHKLRVSIGHEAGDVAFEFTSRRALFDFARGLLWYMASEGGDDTEYVPIADNEGRELALDGVRLSPDSARFTVFYPFRRDAIEGLFPLGTSVAGPPKTQEVWQGVEMRELAREVHVARDDDDFVPVDVLRDQRHKLRVSSERERDIAYIESTSRLALYDFARTLLRYAIEANDGRVEYAPLIGVDGSELVRHAARLSRDSARLVVTFPPGAEEIVELLPRPPDRMGDEEALSGRRAP